MSASELLTHLAGRGVLLRLDGERLKVDAPEGCLTAEDREELKTHKAELLELLTSPNSPPAEENIEMHDSALVTAEAGLELCPECGAELVEIAGEHWLHRYCLTSGHYDAWRTRGGQTLKQAGAPIARRPRASLPAGAEQITAEVE